MASLWQELFGIPEEQIMQNYTTNHRNNIMCVTKRVESPFPVKGGEKWFIRDKEFTIGTTHQKYFDTNGDPDTLYLSMRDECGFCYVITHKAFLDKAKREEPIVERFITPRQILDAKPCEGGIVELGMVLKVSDSADSAWEAVRAIYKHGHVGNAYKISELYNWYAESLGKEPETSYLIFLAKALKLIPDFSNMTRRDTLKRLLGIKE